MGEDEVNEAVIENWEDGDSSDKVKKYCRACELACPVAR